MGQADRRGTFEERKAKAILKVYRMNECDWWCDYSLEQAKRNYINDTCCDVSDTEDSEEQMGLNECKYKDEDMEEAITFAEQLAKMKNPGFFASTEW